MSTTWTKLKDGSWGLRSTSPLNEGATVIVSKRDGTTSSVFVGSKVWSGEGVYLYTKKDISPSSQGKVSCAPRRSSKRPFRPCGYPGCSPSYCDECDGLGMYG
jgi:hypothetical protein